MDAHRQRQKEETEEIQLIKRLICILLAACLLCGAVFAAEPGSLTVKLFYGGAPVSGGSVTL